MAAHPSQKLHGLDHLRALAITLVFFFHYFILSGGKPAWLPDWAGFGWTGVDLFFVLSGFLISSQLFEQISRGERISFKVFFLKRFFRIIPAYLFTVGVYFCIPFFREKEALPPLWKFLTFTQNFGLNIKDSGTFSHAWSLCVEEHFYLLLPLTLIILQITNRMRHSWLLLAGLFVLSFAARLYSFHTLYLPHVEAENNWLYWYQYIYYPTYNRLDGLLAGVGIAAVYQFLPAWWNAMSRYGNVFIFMGLLALVCAYILCEDPQTYPASIFGFPLIALGYGFVVTGAISPGSMLYRWNSRGTSLLATLSYAVYLTHKGIIHMTQKLLAPFAFDDHIILLISILSSLLGAYGLHLVIEKPFLRWRNRLLSLSRKS